MKAKSEVGFGAPEGDDRVVLAKSGIRIIVRQCPACKGQFFDFCDISIALFCPLCGEKLPIPPPTT